MAINFNFRSGAKKSGHLDYPLQSYVGDDGDDGGDDGGDDSDDGYDDGDDGGLMYGEKINHLCSKESTWNMTP